MTRKETKEWAKNMVNHIFHKYHQEVTISGWVARDTYGWLYCYSNKPEKGKRIWENITNDFWLLNIDKDFFHNVKWEDDEPTPATITIKLR